jgi:U6 snRNA-associated Sm-like protein LSm2
VGKEIAVELKNDVVLVGRLHSVDQYLNVKLTNVSIAVDKEKYPQLSALQNCFIRGSVVRYIQIPPEEVDVELLQDAARKENAPPSKKQQQQQQK